jgi:replicative DNA helicase
VVEVPVDPVNEQVILIAAATDKRARERLAHLPPDAFQARGHARIWQAMQEMARQGLEYSPATLQQLAGGEVDPAYLEQLVVGRQAPMNLEHHVDALLWDATRAAAVQGPLSALLRALQDVRTPPERVRALGRHVVQVFDSHGGGRRQLRSTEHVMREQLTEIDARIAGRSTYTFGVEGLDCYEDGRPRLIPGSAPGKVTVVTGLSGCGKSTFAAKMALGMICDGRKVLYGSWENEAGTTLELLAALYLALSRSRLMCGAISGEERAAVAGAMEELRPWVTFQRKPYGRSEGGRWSNDVVLDAIHESIAASGCDVAVFDLWHRAFRFRYEDEVSEALALQQQIAQDTRCHVILVHQQRLKDVEQRVDKRPTREAIKGSSAWVDVADTILGVHWPSLFKRLDDNVLEVDVLKQRFAPWPLAVEFDWDPDTGVMERARTIDYDPDPTPVRKAVGKGNDSLDAAVANKGKGLKDAD